MCVGVQVTPRAHIENFPRSSQGGAIRDAGGEGCAHVYSAVCTQLNVQCTDTLH